jgi:hypothetical protein
MTSAVLAYVCHTHELEVPTTTHLLQIFTTEKLALATQHLALVATTKNSELVYFGAHEHGRCAPPSLPPAPSLAPLPPCPALPPYHILRTIGT